MSALTPKQIAYLKAASTAGKFYWTQIKGCGGLPVLRGLWSRGLVTQDDKGLSEITEAGRLALEGK